MTWLLLAILAVIIQLIVTESFAWFRWSAIKLAVLFLPREARRRYEQEWLAELESISGRRILKLTFLIGVFFTAHATGKTLASAAPVVKRRRLAWIWKRMYADMESLYLALSLNLTAGAENRAPSDDARAGRE